MSEETNEQRGRRLLIEAHGLSARCRGRLEWMLESGDFNPESIKEILKTLEQAEELVADFMFGEEGE